jgi:photosystem II stability/assembly factor-like uncharacterized protein
MKKITLLFAMMLAMFSDAFGQLKITSNSLCEGNNIIIKASDIPAKSVLQWQKNGQDISNATSNEFPANGVGNYNVRAISQEPQWVKKRDPENQYEALLDIFFVNKNVGYAVGGLSKSSIIKTLDGGKTWIEQDPGPYYYLRSVYFTDEQDGWAVGSYNAILHTTDGGKNWNRKTLENTEWDVTYNKVLFIDKQNGWILDSKRRLLKTTDGGITWKFFEDVNVTVGNFYFNNSKHGWAVDFWHIYETKDGGESWTTNYIAGYTQPILEGVSYASIFFQNENIGWIGGYGSMVTTSDAGKTWRKVSGIDRDDNLYKIYFTDNETGFAMTDGRVYYQTNDGGKTWNKKDTGVYGNIVSMAFIDKNNAWATDYRGSIVKMSNQGNTWEVQRGNPETVTKISFASESVGFRTGKYGLVEKTIDGGITWKKQNANTLTDIIGIKFADINTGWILDEGDYGLSTVLKTIDGGATWQKKLINNRGLSDLFFVDAKNGWAVGTFDVYKTTDGGENWFSVSLDRPFFAGSNVYFSDSKNGWILGSENAKTQILKTTNGGVSWSVIQTPTIPNRQNNAYKIYFKNVNEGWVIGTQVVLRTTDGGQTWFEQNFKAQDRYDYLNITTINFADDRNGWVLTSWGKMFRTTDGGATWNMEDSQLTIMSFLNSEKGWAMDANKSFSKFEPVLLATSNVITIKPTPEAKITTDIKGVIYEPFTVKMTANIGTNLSYQWLKDDAIIPNETTANYEAKKSGKYTVSVSKDGCTKTSEALNISIQIALANEGEIGEDVVQVYPNPSRGEFKIILPKTLQNADIQIFDLLGRERTLIRTGEQAQADGLVRGTYFLRVNKAEKSITNKIVIE